MKKFFVSLLCSFFALFALTMFYGDLVFAVKSGPVNKFSGVEKLANEPKMRAIWFSYLDWWNLINVSTKNGEVVEGEFKKNVERVVNNLNSIGINNLFLHVRAFGDAFYPSKLVYRSKFLNNFSLEKLDPLKFFIDCAKSHKIKVHGWMNPMRALNEKDFDKLPDSFKLKQWFANEKLRKDYFVGMDSHSCWVLNPCNDEVIDLVVEAEQELLKNYDLAGIHIDDYFFPSDVKKTEFDAAYYRKRAPAFDIDKFRFQGTYNLVKRMGAKCHEIKPSAVFGAAIIGNFNVNKGLFADVEAWMKDGLVDYLMPEIYYSFENKHMPFDRCVQEWNSLIEKHGSSKLKFYVGLAPYRIGEPVQKSDAGWQSRSGTILKNQQAYCVKNFKNYCGYCLFDYKTVFDKSGDRNQLCKNEIDNLIKS